MRIVKSEKCGHPHNPNIGGGRCPKCGVEKMDSSQHQGTYYRPVVDHATVPRKYHFSNYYCSYRICKNCGEYVPSVEVCPACGKKEMNIVVADKYRYSNPRRCDKCFMSHVHFMFVPNVALK